MSVRIVTNYVPRFPVYGYELTERERDTLGISQGKSETHGPECVACDHDCPWQRHHIGAPFCQTCDDHSEAADAAGWNSEFVRYRGRLYPLSDFTTTTPGPWNFGLPDEFREWDGYLSDSFFSGIVIRYVRDGERYDTDRVILGTYYSEGESE